MALRHIAATLILAAIACSFYAGINGFGYKPMANPTAQYTLALESPEFSDYMHFYQIRYVSNNSSSPVALPEGKVELTIGDPFDGAEQYSYVSAAEVHGHETFNKSTVYSEAVALSEDEINALFGTNTSITQDRIQRADIRKIHLELVNSHPELFPNGTDLHYGVVLDAEENVVLDDMNKPTNDSPLESYQNGKTIVMPTVYNPIYPTRLHLNYNSPAVREYVIRFALKKLSQNKNNAVFIDNGAIQTRLILEDGDYTKPELHYISALGWQEQTKKYVDQQIYIYGEIKKRGNNPKILKNDLRVLSGYADYALKCLTSGTNFDVIDGMMIENDFWSDAFDALETQPSGIYGYLDWIKLFGKKNKMVLFAASTPEVVPPYAADFDDQTARNIWYWVHLVANNNTYFFINKNYRPEMEYFSIYDYPLGAPLEEPHKEGNTWIRKYQRGTIEFDSSLETLSAIKFTEQECIDNAKLLDYISQWKTGNISMAALLQKIAAWKAGC